MGMGQVRTRRLPRALCLNRTREARKPSGQGRARSGRVSRAGPVRARVAARTWRDVHTWDSLIDACFEGVTPSSGSAKHGGGAGTSCGGGRRRQAGNEAGVRSALQDWGVIKRRPPLPQRRRWERVEREGWQATAGGAGGRR